MSDPFTNREIATALLTVVVIGTFMVIAARGKDGIAVPIRGFLCALFQWKLMVSLLLFLAVIGSAILLAHKIGLWGPSLWKDTILWTLLTGVVLCFRAAEALKQPTFFRDKLKQTVTVSAVVEFVANLESFPLWIELAVQAPAVIMMVTIAVSKGQPDLNPLETLAKVYLALLGIAALVWTGWSIGQSEMVYTNLGLELFLPVWLTVVAILYLYPLALFAAHETTAAQMRVYSRKQTNNHRLRKMVAIVLRSGLSLRAAQTLGRYAGAISETDGFRSAWRETVRSIRKNQERIEAEKAAELRLIENAGLEGTGQDGKQLDQREHEATKKALLWLATCQTCMIGAPLTPTS